MQSPRRKITAYKPTLGTPKANVRIVKRPLVASTRAGKNQRKPTNLFQGKPRLVSAKRNISLALQPKNFPLLSDSSNASSRNSSVGSSLQLNSSRRLMSRDEGTPRKETPKKKQSPQALFETLELPLKAGTALKHFMNSLTSYEQGEILEYSEIYFLGLGARKRQPNLQASNYGFDDDRGDYKLVTADHIAYRFEIAEILGKGSFGQVCKCFDHKRKEFIALKIIRNKKRFHRQAAVEVKVLDMMRTNDKEDTANVIHMRNYFMFRKHICITFELLNINLYELMKTNGFQGFSQGLIRRFAVQLLYALSFARKLQIVHCDLKPENIMLKQPNKSGIKVIDFGSACLESEKLYTYIQSRFYRAPEIILGISYSMAIDMWSFGCILAELYMGYPCFPGENENEQLLCIMEVCGYPPTEILDKSSKRSMFFDNDGKAKIEPNSRGRVRMPGTRTISDKVKCTDSKFVDLLSRCLDWNPETRILPEEALKHPWIAEGLETKRKRD